ncbi:hypothetical protein AB990_03555 [Alkalihalobacillus pseudalcaliphilus]|nr:hypothetical protein AB990_03555 [Alkalihalobacillus pseudalcaliphilus]
MQDKTKSNARIKEFWQNDHRKSADILEIKYQRAFFDWSEWVILFSFQLRRYENTNVQVLG